MNRPANHHAFSSAQWLVICVASVSTLACSTTVESEGAKQNKAAGIPYVAVAGGADGEIGAYDVAVTDAGEAIIAGTARGTITLGKNKIVTGGNQAVFVAALDSRGEFQWHAVAAGQGTTTGDGIVRAANGSSFVGGTLQGKATFGGHNADSGVGKAAFVAHVDSTGAFKWVRTVTGATSDYGFSIGGNASGATVVVGDFSSTAGSGSQEITSAGGSDGFVASWDAKGKLRWLRGIGGSGEDHIYAVDVAPDGGAVAAGSFSGQAKAMNSVLTSASGSDPMILRFDTFGRVSWARTFSGQGDDGAELPRFGPDGSITVVGWLAKGLTIGSANLVAVDDKGATFVTRLDAAGKPLWATAQWTADYDAIEEMDLAVDSAGHTHIAGYVQGTVKIGAKSRTAYGSLDAAIIELGTDGNVTSTVLAGSEKEDGAYGIAFDKAGNRYVVGDVSGLAEFGGTAAHPEGTLGLFVWKTAPAAKKSL